MILACQQCLQVFKGKPRRKYCSHSCHHAARRALPDDLVKALAFTGEEQVEAQRRLGVSTNLIARHLRRLNVHEQWREQRWL